jgi:GABA(A) receptor-associated protein
MFKKTYSYEHRMKESGRVISKYPDRIPVIVDVAEKSNLFLDKKKYLVPKNITVGQFLYILRKRIKLLPENGLFLFVNEKIPVISSSIEQIYYEHKEEDNFLYFLLSNETVFGFNYTLKK